MWYLSWFALPQKEKRKEGKKGKGKEGVRFGLEVHGSAYRLKRGRSEDKTFIIN